MFLGCNTHVIFPYYALRKRGNTSSVGVDVKEHYHLLYVVSVLTLMYIELPLWLYLCFIVLLPTRVFPITGKVLTHTGVLIIESFTTHCTSRVHPPPACWVMLHV